MKAWSDLLALVYPEFCYACSETLAHGEKMVCTTCRVKLPYTNYHLLPSSDNPLSNRFYGRIEIENALSYLTFVRAGRVQNLLHNLKYRNVPEIGELLGKWYGSELQKSGYQERFDLILPVPLYHRKLKKRGYNQSDRFAKGLSETLEIPWSDKVIKRNIESTTQTKKSRFARWKNVDKVFSVSKPEEIQQKRILLVDDVLTTGATLEACGQELLQNGCKSLSVATIAAA
ncbi:ComF family protein [Adhaeribacter sp. BT258]|uniref:ComF family protein n=1 Tax=Adhaeribacter terrigena TaxID=2793070 RepID=A0ABS1C2I4_9BACT|nr:ComF family protein [Adhaeribacter terrigena]MBK0403592.1 ComF family protein [Adhaeribacter terrigena]